MLAIPLFGGGHTCVDEKHFDELAKYNWYFSKGYVNSFINGKQITMSRFIMQPSDSEVVDHINGNRLINTEYNLRICTMSQNNKNLPKFISNTSGHKGVGWDKRKNKWCVKITKDGKNHHIGYFDKLEDAAEASKAARLKYHGEYSCFEREEVDMTEFYMAKWHPKSIELFAKVQEPKSSGILNLMELTVAIPTTKDQVAIIDVFDYALVSQYKWCAHYDKHTDGHYAATRIPKEGGGQLYIAMHRLITDAQKGDVVDHKNRTTMDNRNSNLRITDHSGNMRNKGLQSNNKSGSTGVIFRNDSGSWRAFYNKDGKRVWIGTYKTKEEAIAARLNAVRVEYGEFFRDISTSLD